MKLDVIGFGALNLDKLYRVNKIAREDEESFITDLKESAGGSAANTIVGLARLGLKTGFIGKVGADREGELLLQDFRNEEVALSPDTSTLEGKERCTLTQALTTTS
jgi:ribokinase